MDRLRALLHAAITFLSSRSRTELLLLVCVLIPVLCLWGFAELTEEMLEGDTRTFDLWLLQALRSPADPNIGAGPAWLAKAMRDLTSLGGNAILTLVVLATMGYFLLQRTYRTVLWIGSAALGSALLMNLLKWLIERDRPDIVSHLMQESSMSFPSGHATLSAAIYLSLAVLSARTESRRVVRIYIMVLAFMATLLVGFSRVYLGVHYPTDVLAGWSVGLAWATVCWLAVEYLERNLSPPQHRAPERADDGGNGRPARAPDSRVV